MAVYRKKLVDKDGNTIIPAIGDVYGPVYTASLQSASGGIATYTFTPDTPVEANRVYAVKFPDPSVNNAVILLGDGNITASSILLPPVAASDNPSYEIAYTYNINDTEVWLLMYTGNSQWVCMNQKRKVATADLEDNAVGWKYLGHAHTETATNQLDFTLPAQYDNYKIIASSVITSGASNGAWQTLSPLDGSTLINFSGFQEVVNGTNWSCSALSNTDYVSQTTTYPYFSVFHEVISMKSKSAENRHYMTRSVSGGGNTSGKTTRGNMHTTVNTEPTGFRLRMSSNYISAGSIYVWGMNN